MARLTCTAILILFSAAAQTVQVQYRTLPKPEIERRLGAFEDSNVKREQKLHEESGCTGEL